MKARPGFRIVEYSIQSNHLHLIIEAEDNDALVRGMISLKTRIARQLNKFFGRAGQFFADRYHAVAMRTVKQVRRTIVYVLANAKHHGVRLAQAVDEFSSGEWFEHWRERRCHKRKTDPGCPTERYESMLLHLGLHNLGPISMHESPA